MNIILFKNFVTKFGKKLKILNLSINKLLDFSIFID